MNCNSRSHRDFSQREAGSFSINQLVGRERWFNPLRQSGQTDAGKIELNAIQPMRNHRIEGLAQRWPGKGFSNIPSCIGARS